MTIEAIANTTQDVANDFTALLKAGQFDEAGETWWADSVVSLEPIGEGAVTRGIAAVRIKGEQWSHAHEIHAIEVGGPYVHGDQFALRFTMDVTQRASGERMQMDEIGVYTVRSGKIVEERFFYGG
jgi:ketosteroid isomerase-like protein